MHIYHVQGICSPEHGGPTQSLTNYCVGQTAAGHQVDVWALEGFPNTSPVARMPDPTRMHIFPVESPARLGRSAIMKRQLLQAPTPDVYHLHGAWLRAMAYGAAAATVKQRPYVLEIMGMYDPWALKQKKLSKQLARWWFQNRILREAACLHVNSQPEANYLRGLGFKAPIAVIPVGVDLVKIKQLKNNVVPPQERISMLKEKPFFLFLSRLHPKKGLDLLIRSWAATAKERVGQWNLVIAGTGDHEYTAYCRKLAENLSVADQCLWLGHVDEALKSWLFSHAHYYVLPTSSENFGNVVAESLAHGTPVITTIHTPWVNLPKHRCGMAIDNTEADLCAALAKAMATDLASRKTMGEAGERLVRDCYSLDYVLNSVASVYEWVMGSGPKPDCVQFH